VSETKSGKVYLLNAFSLSMLPSNFDGELCVNRNVPLGYVQAMLAARAKGDVVSAVGHPGTADVMTKLLNYPVPVNRSMVTLKPGDVAVVFQLGVRLAEGQVLSAEEVEKLYQDGKASFDLVYFAPCSGGQ
jgi:hypothetical protein